MTWIIRDSEEPRLTREAQELQDRLESERLAREATAELERAQRLANGTAWRRPTASTPTRIVSRTKVTRRGPNGEIEEFERYEMPVKPATRSGHQSQLPDPVIVE